MKFCIKCKTEKPVSEFKELTLKYVKKNGELSLYHYQDPRRNDCRKAYMRRWHKENGRVTQDRLTAY